MNVCAVTHRAVFLREQERKGWVGSCAWRRRDWFRAWHFSRRKVRLLTGLITRPTLANTKKIKNSPWPQASIVLRVTVLVSLLDNIKPYKLSLNQSTPVRFCHGKLLTKNDPWPAECNMGFSGARNDPPLSFDLAQKVTKTLIKHLQKRTFDK